MATYRELSKEDILIIQDGLTRVILSELPFDKKTAINYKERAIGLLRTFETKWLKRLYFEDYEEEED